MKPPAEVRERLKAKLWSEAESLGWSALSDIERSQHYERWTLEPEIGGVLAHFMDARGVRVYIKDSLLKPFERERLSSALQPVFSALSLGAVSETDIVERYIKPHGLCLANGDVVCWGRSRDWKSLLMATFERADAQSRSARGVVLFESGHTSETSGRGVIKRAAQALGIKSIEWIEG